MLMETKKIWQSKGVIGGAVAFIMLIVFFFDLNLSEVEVKEAIEMMFALAGILTGIYGRIVSTKKIGF